MADAHGTAEEMVAIPIREFIVASVVPVDVFVRLGDQKYVLFLKRDTAGAAAQLQGLESKKVKLVFVRKADFELYVGSSIMVAGLTLTQKELSVAKKAEFLASASAAVLAEITALGLNAQSYEHARSVASATAILIESKPDLYRLLDSFSTMANAEFAHSVAASFVATMIAKGLGWTKPATFEKLALGLLLHDIGLKELPDALLGKSRAERTSAETALYESHPERGVNILRALPAVPDDVVAIVLEHHENAAGQGYPRKLRDLRMNPLAKVAALADAFCEVAMRAAPHARMSPFHALAHIEGTMGQPFNREAFAALKELIPPPGIAAA